MDGPSWKKQRTDEGSKSTGHFKDKDNDDKFHKKSNKFGGKKNYEEFCWNNYGLKRNEKNENAFFAFSCWKIERMRD